MNRLSPSSLSSSSSCSNDGVRTRRTRTILAAVIWAGIAAAGIAQTTSTALPPLDIVRNVRYGEVGSAVLLLDIYRLKTPPQQPMPVVVWIHGGAWQFGNKEQPLAAYLAYYGYCVLSIEYRLAPLNQFPAAVEDAKCAVRWVRANAAKMHVDPERIGVWGQSAGGHLAAMVGLTPGQFEGRGGHAEPSSRVQAVCAFCPPTYWTESVDRDPVMRDILVKFLGTTHAGNPELYREASPVTHVTKDAPPFLLVHGDRDVVVPIDQSGKLHDALKEAGVEVKMIRVQHADHSFQAMGGPGISPGFTEIQREVLLFFERHLKKRAAKP